MRTASKKINFGIVYQESPRGLSEDLAQEGISLSVDECKMFIDKYFKRFPKVEKWIKDIKRFAKINKHVRSLTGRVRHLHAIDSIDRGIAGMAERQAVNTPIQSTGSDCTLMSLLQINKWLKENNMKSKMCITVHDSIVIDTHKSELVQVATKMKHIMENLAEYNEMYKFLGDVPIISELEIGHDYGHSFECSIEDLHDVDTFLQKELDNKHKKEDEFFKKLEEQGKDIPVYVKRYWENK